MNKNILSISIPVIDDKNDIVRFNFSDNTVQEFFIVTCDKCNRKFFSMDKNALCNNKDCHNARRREKDHSIYNFYYNKLSSYLGQAKFRLPQNVKSNIDLIKEYDLQRKFYTNQMNEKIKEYKDSYRLPDEELDEFYNTIQNEIKNYCNTLKEKAEKNDY